MPRPSPIETLAYRLSLARKKRGMTQAALAEKSGMKQPDISKIEKSMILTTTGIARLAAALRVTPQWLEMGVGPDPLWNVDLAAPPPPPADFADRREVSESGWSVLEDLKDMPASERDALVTEIHARAEKYRTFMRETLGRLRSPAGKPQTSRAAYVDDSPSEDGSAQ